jgi:hypothetical protein
LVSYPGLPEDAHGTFSSRDSLFVLLYQGHRSWPMSALASKGVYGSALAEFPPFLHTPLSYVPKNSLRLGNTNLQVSNYKVGVHLVTYLGFRLDIPSTTKLSATNLSIRSSSSHVQSISSVSSLPVLPVLLSTSIKAQDTSTFGCKALGPDPTFQRQASCSRRQTALRRGETSGDPLYTGPAQGYWLAPSTRLYFLSLEGTGNALSAPSRRWIVYAPLCVARPADPSRFKHCV